MELYQRALSRACRIPVDKVLAPRPAQPSTALTVRRVIVVQARLVWDTPHLCKANTRQWIWQQGFARRQEASRGLHAGGSFSRLDT